MKQKEILDYIQEHKIVPVVKLDNANDAKPLCEALCRGGLPVAEITFRTEAAQKSIRLASANFPDMLIGAGTIINVDQAKKALDAGADFLVTPGFSRKVVEFAMDNHVLILPGVCTPSEIMAALEYGLSIVKFFPAMQYGGLDTVKALAAPFPSIRFFPTGGINTANILEFLAFERIFACGGSWMVKDSYIKNHDFNKIEQLTKETVNLIK